MNGDVGVSDHGKRWHTKYQRQPSTIQELGIETFKLDRITNRFHNTTGCAWSSSAMNHETNRKNEVKWIGDFRHSSLSHGEEASARSLVDSRQLVSSLKPLSGHFETKRRPEAFTCSFAYLPVPGLERQLSGPAAKRLWKNSFTRHFELRWAGHRDRLSHTDDNQAIACCTRREEPIRSAKIHGPHFGAECRICACEHLDDPTYRKSEIYVESKGNLNICLTCMGILELDGWCGGLDTTKEYKGGLRTNLKHKRINALLLCWGQGYDNLYTEKDVNHLKDLMKIGFGYHGTLHTTNSIDNHKDSDTSIIIYFAGHCKGGIDYGIKTAASVPNLGDSIYQPVRNLLEYGNSISSTMKTNIYALSRSLKKGLHRCILPRSPSLVLPLSVVHARTVGATSPRAGDKVKEATQGSMSSMESFRLVFMDLLQVSDFALHPNQS